MTKPDENRSKWRILRHGAGMKRRIRKLAHMPLKRLKFFKYSGYCISEMRLCYRRRLKLRLGSRRVCVASHTIVALQGER